MASDVTSDYATLECTDDPPINACGYPTTKPVITGPRSAYPAPIDCAASTTGALTNYARRCHRLTGLTPGDTIQFRWVFTSDPATEFKGFYLDDIEVTNIRLPNSCIQGPPADAVPDAHANADADPQRPECRPTPSPTPAAQAVNLSTRLRVDLGDNAGIGGFIITGSAPKHVIIRGLGLL